MLRYNFQDLFKANRLALSPQRIWIQFLGLVVAYLGYYALTFVSLMLAGVGFDRVLSYGLFPSLFAANVSQNIFAKGAFALACILGIGLLLIANAAVCRATFMVLKGTKNYSWREAYEFAFRKASAITLTPATVGLGIFAIVAGAWLVGLFGRIPVLGELAVSVFAPIWILSSLTLIFLMVVGVATLILTPSIIATTEQDAFEAIFQSFSTVWRQVSRFLFYESIVVFLSALGFFGAAVIAKTSVLLMNTLFTISMGKKYQDLISQAQYLLQSWTSEIDTFIMSVFGKLSGYFYFTHDFTRMDIGPTMHWSALLISGSLLCLGGLLVSYFLAIFNSGNTIGYLILHKAKSREDLLETNATNRTVSETMEPTAESVYKKNNHVASKTSDAAVLKAKV